MNTLNEPQSREEIQREFDRLLRRHEARGSQITTKAEEAERLKHDELVSRAADYTVESIVNGLAKLQLGFGSAVDDIAGHLDSESSKLSELRRAIEIERSRLEQLRGTFVAAEALAILEQDHRQKLATFEEDAQAAREALADEQQEVRRQWEAKQQQQMRDDEEYAAQLIKDRTMADEAHAYEAARQARLDADARALQQREMERTIADEEGLKSKDWSARQKVLDDNAERIAELRQRVAGFDEDLKEATKAAREKAISSVHRETKFELSMLDKEHDGNVKVAELKVKTLEERILRHTQLIADLDNKLDSTIAKSQGLAEQAFVRPNA